MLNDLFSLLLNTHVPGESFVFQPSSPTSSGGGEAATVAGFSQSQTKTNFKMRSEKRALLSPGPGFLYALALVSNTDEATRSHSSSVDFHKLLQCPSEKP